MNSRQVFILRDLLSGDYVGVYTSYSRARRALADFVTSNMDEAELREVLNDLDLTAEDELYDMLVDSDSYDDYFEVEMDVSEFH